MKTKIGSVCGKCRNWLSNNAGICAIGIETGNETYPACINFETEEDNMKTVLIVEDDETLNNMVKAKLSRAGHLTYQAFNATEAINILLEIKVDVLFLDYDLAQDTNGATVLQYIKDHKINVGKIYVTSGSNERYQLLNNISPCQYEPKPSYVYKLLELVF